MAHRPDFKTQSYKTTFFLFKKKGNLHFLDKDFLGHKKHCVCTVAVIN